MATVLLSSQICVPTLFGSPWPSCWRPHSETRRKRASVSARPATTEVARGMAAAAAVVKRRAAAVDRRAVDRSPAARSPVLALPRLGRIAVAVEIVVRAGRRPEPIAVPATTAARGKRLPLRSRLDRHLTRAHGESSVGPTRESNHAPMRAASLHRRPPSSSARVAQFVATRVASTAE
jgi:hypothetical protein